MAFVVRRCRELYNAALQERRDAWQKCRKSIRWTHQCAELPAIKDVRPEYHEVHSQVLQDVLTRLDRAFQAFFRRIQVGEKPGYPRFQRGSRYHTRAHLTVVEREDGMTYSASTAPHPPRTRRPLPQHSRPH
jgi:putative transposase